MLTSEDLDAIHGICYWTAAAEFEKMIDAAVDLQPESIDEFAEMLRDMLHRSIEHAHDESTSL